MQCIGKGACRVPCKVQHHARHKLELLRAVLLQGDSEPARKFGTSRLLGNNMFVTRKAMSEQYFLVHMHDEHMHMHKILHKSICSEKIKIIQTCQSMNQRFLK
jgi:hypothetical protein